MPAQSAHEVAAGPGGAISRRTVPQLAGSAALQGGVVAGAADRSLGPAGRRWPGLTAVRADRGGPWCAGRADRGVGVGERAGTSSSALAADRLRALVAVRADIGMVVVGAHDDRGGPPADPAPAMAPGVAAAAFADRPAVGGPARDGLVDPAPAADLGLVPVRARLAHPSQVGAGQRPAGGPATDAGRGRQAGRAAGDQLVHQPADDRGRPHRQGVGVCVQRGGQAPQPGEVVGHHVDGGGDRLDR